MPVPPMVQGLILAESILQDPDTLKITVEGIFNVIEAGTDPHLFDSPASVFFGVTGVHGLAILRLVYVDLADYRVLAEIDVPPIESEDPLELHDVAVQIRRMPIPHDGTYAWELYHGAERLASVRVMATTGC